MTSRHFLFGPADHREYRGAEGVQPQIGLHIDASEANGIITLRPVKTNGTASVKTELNVPYDLALEFAAAILDVVGIRK